MTQNFYRIQVEGNLPELSQDQIQTFNSYCGGFFNRVPGWEFMGSIQEGNIFEIRLVKSGSAVLAIVIAAIALCLLVIFGWMFYKLRVLIGTTNELIDSVEGNQETLRQLITTLRNNGTITGDEADHIIKNIIDVPNKVPGAGNGGGSNFWEGLESTAQLALIGVVLFLVIQK